MDEPIQEIEGTWEEVAAHEAEPCGRQVELLIVDSKDVTQATSDAANPPRGSYTRIAAGLCQHPLGTEAEPDLWEVAAEERSGWRRIAQEKSE